MSKNLVVKDNSLINASYNLDLIEQRLILLAIIQARRSKIPVTKQDKVVINVSEYATEFGVTQTGSLYRNLKSACDVLFERQFSYKEILENGEVKFSKSRWVSKVSYIPESGSIELFFTDDVLQLITMLEEHFTSYELEKVADLNSKYSVRLYEILIAWRSTGKTPIIEVEDIRYRLGVLETEYKVLADFKKRVLDLAVNEINEKTDIQVSYEQHKQGRKIIGFSFELKTKKSTKETTKNKVQAEITAIEQSKDPEQPEINPIFQKYLAYISVSDQKKYLKQYSEEEIKAILERADEYLNELSQKGKKPSSKGRIYKKAFLDYWGKDKLHEKQEAERKKEAIRKEKQAQIDEEKAKEERWLKERERRAETIQVFEALSHEEQEEILNMVQEQLSSFFKTKFIEARKKGEPAHLNAVATLLIQKILFDN